MTHWLDRVDRQLRAEVRDRPGAFKDLKVFYSLKSVIEPFQESLKDARTLEVAQCLARCAISDMVREVVEKLRLRPTGTLASVIKRWNSSDIRSNELLFGSLRAGSVNLAIENPPDERLREVGTALWMAAGLLQEVFPIPHNASSQTMIPVVVYFTIVGYVHQKVCVEKHKWVMNTLVADLKNIQSKTL